MLDIYYKILVFLLYHFGKMVFYEYYTRSWIKNDETDSLAKEKRLTTKSQLLKKIASQEEEILALRAEVAKLKKCFTPLIADVDEYIPVNEIITLMPGNIFWKNKDGKLLGCNNNNASFFGFSSHEGLIGKYSKDFLPPELAGQIDKNDQEIMASGKGRYFEEVGLDINNNTAVFFTQKIPLYDRSNNVIGLLGMAIDITERKKIENELKLAKEKAEALNQAKSQFFALVNHELRTPLTSIIGLVNLLKYRKLNKQEKRDAIKDLENCSFYLLNLVNDILDFSKLEADKTSVNLHGVNINGLVKETTRILSALSKNKDLSLRTRCDKKIPEFILSDTKLLRQILVNIISNAIKFTDKGLIQVAVNLISKNEYTAVIEISVSDTGRGMPKDKLEVIFEPFSQLENIYTRQSSRSGTGLGLAIVKKLVDLLGITIKVNSEEGKGSTFILRGQFDISYKQNLYNTASRKRFEMTMLQGNRKKIKALLVEDDLIVQRIHKSMLTELGCEVDTAACGLDALKMVKDHDILFVDIGLSDITGFEVIKSIRANKAIPIIALTGYTGEKERNKCIDAGANKVVDKPVSLDSLQTILLNFLA